MEKKDNDGGTTLVLNGEHVQRSRLRLDARKWALSKMAPKKYGDKLELGGTGEGGALLIQSIERVIVRAENGKAKD
jgi:hypothetical protein